MAATGEKARKRTIDTVATPPCRRPTPRLASQGHTNAEVSAQLYLSMRTVEWHLSKIFSELGGPPRPARRTATPGSARRLTGQAPGVVALVADGVQQLLHGLPDAPEPPGLGDGRSLATYQPSAVTWCLAR